jgi:dTDP-glucose 4,6-dehydratase
MRLLITGGAGFIGANFVRHALSHQEPEIVVNLDALTYAGSLENVAEISHDPKYRFVDADLRDKKRVFEIVRSFEITHVVHMAAESHVDRSIAAPDDFVQTNVVGTFNLLEACRVAWSGKFGGKRFHHVSTDEVYGALGPSGYFSESSSYAPNSPYSASKAASDCFVRACHVTYGLPTVITHCSNNYGPWQHPEKFIPTVIQAVRERRPIPLYGNGENVRDWLHVSDHCEALWRVLISERAGETYDIGADNEWTNLHLVERICDLIDQGFPELGGNSRGLISFVSDRPGHDWRYAIDSSKIKRELGWSANVRFEKGLAETVAWYLSQAAWCDSMRRRGRSGTNSSEK